MKFSLSKHERLTFTRDIELLFKQGKVVYASPIKLLYVIQNREGGLDPVMKCGFIVSKRLFHHANKRNRIKRLMKESYRLQKYVLQSVGINNYIKLLLIYTGKEIIDFNTMQCKIQEVLLKLKQRL